MLRSALSSRARHWSGGGAGGGGGGGADDIIALKHVVRRAQKDIRFIEQLEAEYEVGQRVCHAGLRRTFDLRVSRNLFRRATQAVLSMEFFRGEPLGSAYAAGQPSSSP